MKIKSITSFACVLAWAFTNALNAQTPFNPTAYSGWMSTPNNYFANLPVGTGVTFHQPYRGAGNQFSTATDGINSGQWQNTSSADAIAANRYFAFSVSANTPTTLQVDSLLLVLARSGTGPDSCILQYKSPLTGYTFVPVTSATYTILNPTTNPTTSIHIIPASPLTVSASDSIVFRLVAWHASSSLGKMRIVNNTSVYGSSMPAIQYAIGAPVLQTTSALCVSPVIGDSVQVTFNSVGTFNSGNTYSLELSDASGSFSVPVTVGSLNSQANSGTISGFIPAGTTNGTYRLRIKSSNPAVTGLDTTNLPVNPGLVLSASVFQPACPDSTGSVDLMVNGGSGILQYNWSNGASTEDLNNLAAGNLGVIVTDSVGCSADTSFQITAVPAFAVSDSITDNMCHSGSDGEISVTIAGGTSPYTVSWSGNGISQTGLTAVNLPAGNYDVLILDANNCPYTDSYSVTEPSSLSVSAVITPAVCASCNGNIALMVSGGTGPYAYDWSNNATSSQILGMPGTYCVEVSDANMCSVDSCFVISSTAGINEAGQDAFHVFPNPASEYVQFSFSAELESGSKKLTITDLFGKVVYQSVFSNEKDLEIAVKNWSNGTYLFQITTGNGTSGSGKILVSH